MSRLYVVRHGETDYNREGRYQGSTDVSLNDKGREQAEEAARALSEKGIAHIFSSPLKRARETAEIIAAQLKLPIEFVSDLRERSLGRFEGQTKEDLERQFPGIWDGKPTRQMFEAPEGAESLVEFAIRVHGAYHHLHQRFAGQPVLLVCHGGVARTLHGLLYRVSDADYFSYRLANGAVDTYPWE